MQKKLLLVCTIVVSALASRAQVEKNDWLLGGYFNFNTSTSSASGNGSNSSSNSNVSPELGFAVGKNSIVGFRGSVSISTSKDIFNDKTNNYYYAAGIFWKKFFPINERVGWYGDLSGGYTYLRSDYPNITQQQYFQQQSGSGYYVTVAPGVYYKAGKKIFLNAGIGGVTYNHSKSNYVYSGTSNNAGDSKYSAFNVNLLNYFSFGVSFILNKERHT